MTRPGKWGRRTDMTLTSYLILSAILFTLGVLGVC